jgi:hypothetical protein
MRETTESISATVRIVGELSCANPVDSKQSTAMMAVIQIVGFEVIVFLALCTISIGVV